MVTKPTVLGPIPEDWLDCKFEDIFTGFSSGMTPYRGNPEYYKGDIPWITSGELNYNIITDTIEKITKDAVVKTNLKLIPIGTFLMAITGLEAAGTRGSCGITGVEATTNQSCMALYPIKGKSTTEYLYHFYVRYGNEFAFQYCQGTKQQSYTGKLVKILPIVLPPTLTEQKAITDALSDMDELIANLERLIAKKKAIKQGAMQQLLKPKENWVTKKIADITLVSKSGGTPSSSVKEYYNGTIPFLSIGDMTSQGKYISFASNKISQKGLENSASWVVDKGSIIYSMYASVGLVSITKINVAISQAVLCLKFKKECLAEFMYYLLVEMQSRVMKYVGEGTQKNLNAQTVKEFIVQIPPYEAQIEIARTLSTMDEDIEVLESKMRKLKDLKQGMMQELLSGKTRLI